MQYQMMVACCYSLLLEKLYGRLYTSHFRQNERCKSKKNPHVFGGPPEMAEAVVVAKAFSQHIALMGEGNNVRNKLNIFKAKSDKQTHEIQIMEYSM